MKKKNIILLGIGAAIAAAASIFLIYKKKTDKVEKPPKGAPQLNLENPGDQSEFSTSASGSDLG